MCKSNFRTNKKQITNNSFGLTKAVRYLPVSAIRPMWGYVMHTESVNNMTRVGYSIFVGKLSLILVRKQNFKLI